MRTETMETFRTGDKVKIRIRGLERLHLIPYIEWCGTVVNLFDTKNQYNIGVRIGTNFNTLMYGNIYYFSQDELMHVPDYKAEYIPYKTNGKYEIKKVIFNDPATIVFWTDGTKTVVKDQGDKIFDQEKGLAMAIAKKTLGNKGNYYNEFKKWINEPIFIS